jgi:hypothetical protein
MMEDDVLDPRRYLPGGPPREFRARSIMATFPTWREAVNAREELKKAGFEEAQVDEVTFRPSEAGSLREQPWPFTLTGQPDRDTRGLAAQDPSVGGHALGGEKLPGGHHYLLTVPARPEKFPRALEIIRKHGGNPDTGGPR